ncbi:MAG: hypothetical protein QG629_240 [Patescibacteria group bacterium]|nr:hypothetical protein [Patescibacteria group bacterium]
MGHQTKRLASGGPFSLALQEVGIERLLPEATG